MNNIISLSKDVYTKDSIYSSINEWKKYLDVNILNDNNNTYSLTIIEKDINKIEEFLNYILDKNSIEEIAS
jgi:hypothetical protein